MTDSGGMFEAPPLTCRVCRSEPMKNPNHFKFPFSLCDCCCCIYVAEGFSVIYFPVVCNRLNQDLIDVLKLISFVWM